MTVEHVETAAVETDPVVGETHAATDATAATATTTATTAATVLQPVEVPKPLVERIPEKHRVMKPDGTLDLEASLDRVETHRASLESRIGSGDIRPKAATDYKLELPEQFKPMLATLPEEGIKAFQEKAFGAGLTQKQYDFVMAEYLSVAPSLVAGAMELDMESAVTELKQTWTDPATYNANLAHAGRAARTFGGEDAAALASPKYANDPVVIRLLARIGAEVGEDRAPHEVTPAQAETVDQLRASEAYRNPKHVDHERVSKQVSEFNQRAYGTTPIR